MMPFRGIVRKVAILTLAATALGWFLVVIGYGIGTVEKDQAKDGANVFPFWAVIIGGPVAIAVALIHAALHQKPFYSALGGVVAFLGSFFVASLGMYLYITGQSIRIINESDFSSQQPFVNLQFTGSLFAILGWTATMVLASFYDYGQTDEGDYPTKS